MRRTMLALTAVVVSAAAMFPAVATSTAPAKRCTEQTKRIGLPYKPDVHVTVDFCIKRTRVVGRLRWYEAYVRRVSWDGTGPISGGTRFDRFYLDVRAERNNVSGNQVRIDLTDDLNGHEAHYRNNFHDDVAEVRATRRGWTADATIAYDANDDPKKGMRKVQLTGTAAVR